MKATLHFDGGARPTNPGHAGCGVVLDHPTGKIQIGRYLGWRTNNEAEYMGLIIGLKVALDMGVDVITVHTDSKMIEGQMERNWACRSQTLFPFYREAMELFEQFNDWKVIWAKRDKNTEADDLATRAIKRQIAVMHNANPWKRRLKEMEVKHVPDPFQ